MKIIANKLISHKELVETKQCGHPVKDWIKHDLTNAVANKLYESAPLFYVEELEDSAYTEFRIELIVLSKATFNNVILTLQENDIKKTVREKIRDILMNSL